MEISREEFIEVYEKCVKELINQQAGLVIEINNLIEALNQHSKDECLYNLKYDAEEETGIYSYTRSRLKKIGF